VSFGSFPGLLWTNGELVEVIKFMLIEMMVLSVTILIWQRVSGKLHLFGSRVEELRHTSLQSSVICAQLGEEIKE
jgi:hypothetical protein